MNEIDAVKALKQGDKKVFRYLFESYYNRLTAYILTYTQNKMEAEDIVQQAFINLWEDREKLHEIRSPKNYLYAIAYNRYVDSIRNEKKRSKLLDDIWERSLAMKIEEDNETQQIRIKKLKSIIETLPTRCKEIILMNKIQGIKYKEIAEILGISVKTVETQMRIAFKKIREGFENDKFIFFFVRNLFRKRAY